MLEEETQEAQTTKMRNTGHSFQQERYTPTGDIDPDNYSTVNLGARLNG